MYYCKKIIKRIGLSILILTAMAHLGKSDSLVHAMTLKIQSKLSVTIKKDTIDIRLFILNKGQETAYDINARVHFLGEVKESATIHHLHSGNSETITMLFDLQKNRIGDYPLIIQIQFHDINLYPFYSLNCTPIHIHCQKLKDLFAVHVPKVEISSQKNIHVQINNMDHLKKAVTVQMIVPDSFSCKNQGQQRLLTKGQSTDIEYSIVKQDALPGTTHFGYVLVTYKKDSIPHAQVTSFKIEVKPDARSIIFDKTFAAMLCVFCGMIWILFLTFVSFRNRR